MVNGQRYHFAAKFLLWSGHHMQAGRSVFSSASVR